MHRWVFAKERFNFKQAENHQKTVRNWVNGFLQFMTVFITQTFAVECSEDIQLNSECMPKLSIFYQVIR